MTFALGGGVLLLMPYTKKLKFLVCLFINNTIQLSNESCMRAGSVFYH